VLTVVGKKTLQEDADQQDAAIHMLF